EKERQIMKKWKNNRKYLKAKTIDGMFDSNMDAFLASMAATSPV
ncbi:hypothetical protein C818_02602, partial [Lachnospiraceae bacterium MD308]